MVATSTGEIFPEPHWPSRRLRQRVRACATWIAVAQRHGARSRLEAVPGHATSVPLIPYQTCLHPFVWSRMADHTVGHLGGSDLRAGENRYSSSRSRSWFAWLSVNVASYTFQFSGGNAGGICVAAGWTVARHWMTSVAAGCAEPCC